MPSHGPRTADGQGSDWSPAPPLDGIQRPSRTPLQRHPSEPSRGEVAVKARAYHATVDVAQTRTFAGVRSCWAASSEVRFEARLSTRMSGSVFICRMRKL